MKTRRANALRSLTFNFLGANRKHIAVKASCLVDPYPDRESCTISAQYEANDVLDVVTMGEDIEFLRKVIDQSTEAMWCIEFRESVDLP